MGLPWVRLDTAFPRNPKILALIGEKDGFRAAFVWLAGLAYCGEQGTDGFIPAHALGVLHARPRDAQLLVEHRLWSARRQAGWMIHDWAEFQESNADTRKRSERAQAASRKGNCIRWHGEDCGCWKDAEDLPRNDPAGSPVGDPKSDPKSDPPKDSHERTDGRTNERTPSNSAAKTAAVLTRARAIENGMDMAKTTKYVLPAWTGPDSPQSPVPVEEVPDVGEPIFRQLEHEGILGHALDVAENVVRHLTTHTDTVRYHASQQDTTAPGASMSLSSILDDVETAYASAHSAVTKGISDLRNVATAVDNDPVVQSALNVAAEVAPEVRAVVAAVIPELSAVHPSVVADVLSAIRGLLAVAPKAAPAPPAA